MANHELMDGRLHVYKRDNSRYWQCDTRIGGRRYRMTTHEDGIERAKDIAEDWYLGLRGKLRSGDLEPRVEADSRLPAKKRTKEKTFREAAEQFQLEYGALTDGQRSARWVKTLGDKIRVYLNPFFGDLGLSEVTSGKIQEYRLRRVTNSKNGKPPARSTMHHEIVTIRQVLKTAMRHGWLGGLPDLSAPYRSAGKISHRAWFSPEEYKRLYTATRERAREPKNKRWKWTCEQMHDYVLFMANTGLRPDEARRLEFRDVQIVEDDDSGETILEIEVRGKRGVGDESMRLAHKQIDASLAQDLLDRIHAAPPEFFERLIVKLLLNMGYGGSAADAGRAIGGSGDDGVDGVIDQDALGLDRVYVQAKRYKQGNNIGSGAIRDFFGSLDRHKAAKGLFVTTSTFSSSARETAEHLSKRIVLIDGDQLTMLMIRHNVGCRVEDTLHIKKIDEDFFE